MFLIKWLTLVLAVLLAGCGGGGGGSEDPTPPPWDPVDPDPDYSLVVDDASDYFGVVADRELIYYTKIVYEEDDPAYTYGSLKFTATDTANFYSLTDDLSLFQDNITDITYGYIQIDGSYYYLFDEPTETTGVLALTNPVSTGSTSNIWGVCTATEDVTIPIYGGTSDTDVTYAGCFVFEATATDEDSNVLTVKIWFAPNIGIVKKEEVITGAPGYALATRTWYLYGQITSVVAEQITVKTTAFKVSSPQAATVKFNALINKSWQKTLKE